ncbi:MAG: large repetitive protein [Gaiellaceae bacterium]|nr:large repetitive protein [Gaiellaceae bacterium]
MRAIPVPRARALVLAIVGFAAAATAGSAGAVTPSSFGTAATYAAGAGAISIVAADLDHNGSKDLAVANQTAGTITILLGNGRGSFTAAAGSPIALAIHPSAIAAADLDGDGRPELVLAGGTSSSTITLLLNDGGGAFTTYGTFATSSNPSSVTASDFNGDGTMDVAVACYEGFSVNIFLGGGSSHLTAAPSFSPGGPAATVAAPDLNGDGKRDLVSMVGDGTVSIGIGAGDGTFSFGSRAQLGSPGNGFALNVATGDFNEDGKADLASADLNRSAVDVALGDGSSLVFPGLTLPALDSAPRGIATADFNGDSHADLVVSRRGADDLVVLHGAGSGNAFGTPTTIATGTGPVSVVTADFDGNGSADLATANYDAGTVSVALNSAGGSGGGGGGSGSTEVTATVAPTLTVSAPASIAFPTLAVGQTSSPLAVPITVSSNATGGYQLGVTRTAFSAGDIPLSISSAAPASGMLLDLSGTTAIPTAGSLNVGHRTSTITAAGGDSWPTSLVLGPVPLVASGTHTSTVTFTVTGL